VLKLCRWYRMWKILRIQIYTHSYGEYQFVIRSISAFICCYTGLPSLC